MNANCPNCDGGLVLRPTRLIKPFEVAKLQIKNKFLGRD